MKRYPRFGDGFDIPMIARLLVKSLPERRHVAIEVSFLDEAVRPNVLDQFFLRDGLPSILKKHQEHFENCG
jgi:hypothetical protein